ncbi:alpha/beta hydrolase [Anatilimnocola sp. NA78]|uniref:alpha/beta hydrolase n=1 Tax=Anatilimnocola sp. NA78 TaxID=3415683 RepID=UPI003CE4BF71
MAGPTTSPSDVTLNTTPVSAGDPKQRTGLRKVRYGLWRVLRFAALAYVSVILMLLWMETALVYPAPQYPVGNWQAAQTYGWEEVDFKSADGTKLHGWYRELPKSQGEPQAVMLYCHGNGENIAHNGDYLADVANQNQLNIFMFDYRGYGRSEGKPTEAGVLADGEAAQQWLAERARIPANQIVLMGRSLGGGVAVDLAARNGCRGLILQNTFTSMPDAAARMYPWAPIQLLMKNRYNSLEKITKYRGPLLQSHGDRDTLVPFDIGQKLHAAAPGPKEFFVNKGLGHNDAEPPEYDKVLAKFIKSLPLLSTPSNEREPS